MKNKKSVRKILNGMLSIIRREPGVRPIKHGLARNREGCPAVRHYPVK